MKSQAMEQAYELARERYAALGVDTAAALKRLGEVAISVHCWQGDDIGGFDTSGQDKGGGILATGNYPGRARTGDELRSDLEEALRLIPGKQRVNLHAMYAETGGKVERNALEAGHFASWVDWAKGLQLGLDFNGTFFGHARAASGFTLASADEGVRRFWVEHGQACRRIGASFGKALGTACVTNVWIPDGYKDTPVDRKGPRERLRRSLDKVFAEPLEARYNLDAVEGKLFGIGSESYVVGSQEFYLGYALTNGKLLCLDTGHYHPTEVASEKVSAVLTFLEEVLLHVSRPVRWDSDHVVTFSDELRALMGELVRGDYLGRVHIGLDYFDASINRVAAWVIGTRAARKALLEALLEPTALLREMEAGGDLTGRLAMLEEAKMLPLGAVWDYYCLQADVPAAEAWLKEVRRYEAAVQSKR